MLPCEMNHSTDMYSIQSADVKDGNKLAAKESLLHWICLISFIYSTYIIL